MDHRGTAWRRVLSVILAGGVTGGVAFAQVTPPLVVTLRERVPTINGACIPGATVQTTIKTGQAVKFVMISGGPHNVAFDPATVPADSKDQLNANMTGQISELSSPMLMNPNEAYTISFAGVKPGTYPFHCTPHLAMNMKGTITVQ